MISKNQMLLDVRRKDDNGLFVPFTIEAVQCDRKKKLGGSIIEYKNVRLPKREAKEMTPPINKGGSKKTNHRRKGTMNVVFPSGEIRKTHILLITKFNGQPVI